MKEEGKCMHEYGPRIQRLAKKIKYLADENLVKHNLTIEQVKLLRFIEMHSDNNYVYQKEIEKEFEIKRSSVTNILQNMEKSELITRENDPADARIKKVLLTDKGLNLSHDLKDFINGLEELIVKDMSTKEKELFVELLKRALNNVEGLM